jgi:asparagine synthase (glutamine-hydrolysing)
MPIGEWSDYKNHITAKPAGRDVRWLSSPAALRGTYRNQNSSWNSQTATDEANHILSGELKFFSHQFIKTGFPPNWHHDYVTLSSSEEEESLPSRASTTGFDTGRENHPSLLNPPLSAIKHWSQIPDDHVAARRPWSLSKQSPRNRGLLRREEQEPSSQRHIDIKFVWEPNRFAFVYTLVRAYVATHNEEYPEAFWTLIEDWAQHNPPNTGPNWMDGQEIALRLTAWTFGYHAFLNSPSTTHQRKENFILFIAAQADRIYKNIDYAISTRSNHTISEAFGLWMVGLLFSELKHAEKYFTLGKQLLEGEATNQIFPDGSYSMYSLNYHRFILHIYLYAIRLGEINDPSLRGERISTKQAPTRFSDDVYKSVAKSIEYLSNLINPETGEMPVYGSNDGALVLPLNDCDFTDYRPLLQLGWYITKGEFLFEPGPWDEDIFWLTGETAGRVARSDSEGRIETTKAAEALSFPNGGTYLLRNTDSHALIRCTDFTSRPSHADQLHVDLWIHGHNLAVDAGTYLYSGQGQWRNGLAHTSVHNTVTVDNKDQMTLLSRFTWTNWSKGKVLKHEKDSWQGEQDGYKPVSHKRTVMVLEEDRWLVIDNLIANESHNYKLHWLLSDFPFEQKENSVLLYLDEMKYKAQVGMINGDGKFSIVRADPNSTRGWRSRYYGHKEPAISVMLEADSPQLTFWSFFGFEDDLLELEGNILKINSKNIPLAE